MFLKPFCMSATLFFELFSLTSTHLFTFFTFFLKAFFNFLSFLQLCYFAKFFFSLKPFFSLLQTEFASAAFTAAELLLELDRLLREVMLRDWDDADETLSTSRSALVVPPLVLAEASITSQGVVSNQSFTFYFDETLSWCWISSLGSPLGKRRSGSFDSLSPLDARLTFRRKHVEAIRFNLCSLEPCWGTAYNFLRYGTALSFIASSLCKESATWLFKRAAFDYLNNLAVYNLWFIKARANRAYLEPIQI